MQTTTQKLRQLTSAPARLALALVLAISLVPAGVFAPTQAYAQDDVQLQEAATTIEIGTADELKAFADKVNSGDSAYTSANVVLTDNIDLSDECSESKCSWTPIGTGYNTALAFQGTFDGRGYSIEGLYVNINASSSCAGLFGLIRGATIKNFTVDGSVYGVSATGGIVGEDRDGSILENLCNKATVSGAGTSVAGIAGNHYSGTALKGLVNRGNITATADVIHISGITGLGTGRENINCINAGSISTGNNARYAGAIAGYSYSTKDSPVVFSGCMDIAEEHILTGATSKLQAHRLLTLYSIQFLRCNIAMQTLYPM